MAAAISYWGLLPVRVFGGNKAGLFTGKGSWFRMTEITFHPWTACSERDYPEAGGLFNETIGKEKYPCNAQTPELPAQMPPWLPPADDIENMPDVIQLYSESVNLIRDYKYHMDTEDGWQMNNEKRINTGVLRNKYSIGAG